MCYSRILDVYELFHRKGIWKRLLDQNRRNRRFKSEKAHIGQDHNRLLRADCLFAQPTYRCKKLSSCFLYYYLLRSILFPFTFLERPFSRGITAKLLWI